MSARRVVIPQRETKDQPCPCGCAPCEDTCCQLDCLERPNFFCGQLLTDQDLTALVDWTRDRLGLTRFRHGWGVVCGLQVRCDPDQPGQIIVGEGYAVSCCGDDIVVCEDKKLDLRDACRRPEAPCEEPRIKVVGVEGESGSGEDERSSWQLVDLYLQYSEKPAKPQTALARDVCREVAECEYSRIKESSELSWRPAVSGSDPMNETAQRWLAEYRECVTVLKRFRRRFPTAGEGHTHTTAKYDDNLAERAEAVRRWLLDWIAKYPVQHFCCMHDAICDMSETDLGTESEALMTVLFKLVQDCRNAYLGCSCHDCNENPGVPLARVALKSEVAQDGTQRCKVCAIDPYPPYRRPISTDCWPAPLGQVNVGRVIWHRPESACTLLAELGMRVAGKETFRIEGSLSDLQDLLDRSADLFARCGSDVALYTINDAEFGDRVVGVGPPAEVIRRPRPVRDVTRATIAQQAPETVDAVEEKGRRDNLEDIEGVGKAIAGAFYKHQVYTFAQLAAKPSEELIEILKSEGMRGASKARCETIRQNAEKLVGGV